MKKPDYTLEHISKSGERYTQEVYSNGAACWEVIKDSTGREIQTGGSGGWRPWMDVTPAQYFGLVTCR